MMTDIYVVVSLPLEEEIDNDDIEPTIVGYVESNNLDQAKNYIIQQALEHDFVAEDCEFIETAEGDINVFFGGFLSYKIGQVKPIL